MNNFDNTLLDTFSFEIKSAIVASDARISSISVFADMVWNRTEYAESRTSWKGAKVHWRMLFERYGETHHSLIISFMEFAYALLFDPIEEDRQRDTKTIQNNVKCLDNFLQYLQDHRLYNIADLDHNHLQDYLKWLLVQREISTHKRNNTDHDSIMWAGHRVSVLQLYHRYSKRVSQPLLIHPFHGEGVFRQFRTKRRNVDENTTPIIPKIIWDPFLCAALDYVEIYANDILIGQKEIEKIRSNILPNYIDLPVFKKQPQYFTTLHVNPVLKNLKHAFVLNPKTGMPWRTNWLKSTVVQREMRALHDACLVVIAGLSGMRENELSLIQVNGFWKDTSPDGSSLRYQIESRVTKGNGDRKRRWEVNEPVFRACEILTQLTSYARAHVRYRELFIQAWDIAPTALFSSDLKETKLGYIYGRTAILPVAANSFTRYLRRFSTHLNEAFDGQYRLPLIEAKPWIFVTRMLRRSLAGRIAREPFGTIAGMLHYKHLKITTFLGYAGSDDNWLEDLHDEELAANEEFLEQVWEDLQEGALAGAKGEEMVREFKGMAGDLKKNALIYFLESNRANLHVGLLNYCVFQKERALCLMGHPESAEDVPVLNACHPDRCANSCIARNHLPQWEAQVNDAQAMLNHSKISEPQKIALMRDLEKTYRIVNRLKTST